MIKNKLYGPAADIFSYGVMLYRMLCGSKPFKGKVDRDLDKVGTAAHARLAGIGGLIRSRLDSLDSTSVFLLLLLATIVFGSRAQLVALCLTVPSRPVQAVIERKPQFPKEIFSKEAILLLTGLLQKRPENRMGCGERGIEEIKVRGKKRGRHGCARWLE